MAGNLFEWCWDWGDAAWYQDGRAAAPNTPGPRVASTNLIEDVTRVMRGGSWGDSREEMRCAARAFNTPEDTGNGIGFRTVRRDPRYYLIASTQDTRMSGSTVMSMLPYKPWQM